MEYNLKLNEAGLIPVIVTDAKTGEVLMLAWMNKEALDKTVETKKAHYYSRSRQAIWMKGETSGNVQTVVSIKKDCDGDTLLMAVEQEGAACHTGERSCFYSDLFDENTKTESSELYGAAVLKEVYRVVTDRKKNPKEGSYTNYLFDKGIDKILKKVGEEASEVIIKTVEIKGAAPKVPPGTYTPTRLTGVINCPKRVPFLSVVNQEFLFCFS